MNHAEETGLFCPIDPCRRWLTGHRSTEREEKHWGGQEMKLQSRGRDQGLDLIAMG